MKERQMIEQLKDKLMDFGYKLPSMKSNFRTGYGKVIDLVVFESGDPKVVFYLRASTHSLLSLEDRELGFNPIVRKAQSLAQEIGAPYFAVSDGTTILYFDVDKEQGRPRLLKKPILPAIQEQDEKSIENGKNQLLHLLFSLIDIGRNSFELQESIINAGIAVLARFWSEEGDRKLEDLLIDPPPKSDLADFGLSDLIIAQDERCLNFYPEAFLVLDNIQLSNIPPRDFIDALDELVQFYINQDRESAFKLPVWISELMAYLADVNPTDEILDIYSTFGDGVAAINKANDSARVFSITSNASSYLWDKLKRLSLGLDTEDVIRINALSEWVHQEEKFSGQPDQILVAPPFGARIEGDSFSGTSENFFLELSLEWVRPGGRVIAIMPENLLFSRKQESIRRYIMTHTQMRAIFSLEKFLPGTNVKASILVLDNRSPENHVGRVMMCRILDQDVWNFSIHNKPLLSNKRIREILEIYRSHLKNGIILDEKGGWFVPFEDLDLESWAVDNYDPEKGFEISSQYPVLHLKELAELRKGSPLTLDKNGSLLVIGPGAVRTLSINLTKLGRTTEERLPKNPVKAQTNDILVHAVGKYRGQAALVEPDFEGLFVSRNVIIVYSISPRILPGFLVIALNSGFVKRQFEERTTGSVIRQLTIGKLEDLLIPVPDLSTQRAIVRSVSETRRKLVKIEEQVLVMQSDLKEQERNLQSILDNLHTGGGEDA